jgi:branched-chain amino acid transport system ATP-binding protein
VLEVRDLRVTYGGGAIGALDDVSLRVAEGQVVVLLGANGAGKTTLLRAVTGLLAFHGGQVRAGSVRLDGAEITGLEPSAIVRRGVSQVMEGRRVFAGLTVEENLQAGGFSLRDRERRARNHRRVLDLFPVLAERRVQKAGLLSGGEQQMLAIGRALMQAPRLLLLDEPSLGLAPRLIEQVRGVIAEINAQGTGVVLIEQNSAMALSVAHYGYVLERRRVVRAAPAAELRADPAISALYLGGGPTGRRRDLAARDPGRQPRS